MAQVLEWLPSKYKILSSSFSTIKKKAAEKLASHANLYE
jgi:hypothetical protein